MFSDWIPNTDATVVKRVLDAGVTVSCVPLSIRHPPSNEVRLKDRWEGHMREL